jgi:hypothetical protein
MLQIRTNGVVQKDENNLLCVREGLRNIQIEVSSFALTALYQHCMAESWFVGGSLEGINTRLRSCRLRTIISLPFLGYLRFYLRSLPALPQSIALLLYVKNKQNGQHEWRDLVLKLKLSNYMCEKILVVSKLGCGSLIRYPNPRKVRPYDRRERVKYHMTVV